MFMKEPGETAFQGRDKRREAVDEAATQHLGAGALPYRRGSGDMRRPCVAGTATPNDRQSLSFSSLTRPWVPGSLRQGCGVERPTVVIEQQAEIVAKEDLVDIRRRCTLWATIKCQRRVFPCGFPLHVENHGSSRHFALIPTASGAASAASAYPRIAATGGGVAVRDSKRSTTEVRVRVSDTKRMGQFRLEKPSGMPSDPGASWSPRLTLVGDPEVGHPERKGRYVSAPEDTLLSLEW
jgi:hypothetical protein